MKPAGSPLFTASLGCVSFAERTIFDCVFAVLLCLLTTVEVFGVCVVSLRFLSTFEIVGIVGVAFLCFLTIVEVFGVCDASLRFLSRVEVLGVCVASLRFLPTVLVLGDCSVFLCFLTTGEEGCGFCARFPCFGASSGVLLQSNVM